MDPVFYVYFALVNFKVSLSYFHQTLFGKNIVIGRSICFILVCLFYNSRFDYLDQKAFQIIIVMFSIRSLLTEQC